MAKKVLGDVAASGLTGDARCRTKGRTAAFSPERSACPNRKPLVGLALSPHRLFSRDLKEAPNVSFLKFRHAMVSTEFYVSLILVLFSLFLQP